MIKELLTTKDEWDAEAPPELEFLFEARVKLHLPPLVLGSIADGDRIIYTIKGGNFEGPHLKGRVFPNSGADWIKVRSDGTGLLDVRFCLETHDNALIYSFWQGRFWCNPEDAEYAFDVDKKDDPQGAWRYYFRAAPFFETSHPNYSWLNNIVSITKSRTGDGGPIHRFFAVK
ncbi:DUF3237 domain-containing protein [Marinicella sp. W31]|uniref:DUF3237 domain-containing protein n=1 Tax=Marinicella sp. W31 TaxID=3023713 RepID=UPI003757A665